MSYSEHLRTYMLNMSVMYSTRLSEFAACTYCWLTEGDLARGDSSEKTLDNKKEE